MLYVNLLLLVPLNGCHLFDCAYLFTSIMKGLLPVNTICTGLWWLPGQLMWIHYTTNGELSCLLLYHVLMVLIQHCCMTHAVLECES